MLLIAELEKNLITERVKEGLKASKKRGKKLGRPKLEKKSSRLHYACMTVKNTQLKKL